MTLELDCVRDVLLAVEALEFNQHLHIGTLHEQLSQYSEEQLTYTCLILKDGSYLDIETISPMAGSIMPGIKSINHLTYKGHEFLANIRDSKIWTGIKGVAGKVGSKSLDAVVQIASNVITALIKAQFGLP